MEPPNNATIMTVVNSTTTPTQRCIHLPDVLRSNTALYDEIDFYLFGIVSSAIIVIGLGGNIFAVRVIFFVLFETASIERLISSD